MSAGPRPGFAPDWLTARPIAHRGLHDLGKGVVENSLGAARAAIEHGFAIECDVQLTADGDAVVFHDFELDRLTVSTGPVVSRAGTALRGTPYAAGRECIAGLDEMLDLIAGRAPLICEIKSHFDGDLRLTRRVRDIVSSYDGPVALKSFDPVPIAHLRAAGAPCPLGIVAEATYDDPEWAFLTVEQKRGLGALSHFPETAPDFLSFWVQDLPLAAPVLYRSALGRPVMSWTVRTAEQRARAARWADQMVFEGFVP